MNGSALCKKILDTTGHGFLFLGQSLFGQKSRPEFTQWFGDHGDQVHRLNYPLNAESVVVDLGGYLGQWASDIHARFRCHVHVFEPGNNFCDYIAWRFRENPQVTLHRVGLGDRDHTVALSSEGDRSSVLDRPDAHTTTIEIKQADSYFKAISLTQIHLLKINIEGAEFDLLDHLIANDWLQRIDHLQVQFHDFAPDAPSRRENIRQALTKTHRLTYDYPFVWENWTRKGVSLPESPPSFPALQRPTR